MFINFLFTCFNSLKIKKRKRERQDIIIWIYRCNNFPNSKNEKCISFIKSFFVVIFVRKFFCQLFFIINFNIFFLINKREGYPHKILRSLNNISNLITYNISFRVLYSRIHRCVFTRAGSLKTNGVTCSNNLLDV